MLHVGVRWLNYHHLHYFWLVVREGGVARAAKRLRVSHPTVSAQIKTLERELGEQLLVKKGRSLAMTDAGRVAYGFAEQIFALGGDLVSSLEGRPTGRPQPLSVGVAEALPKQISKLLLEPAMTPSRERPEVRLVVHEGTPERLLALLALHDLDVLLTDAPVGAASSVRAHSHLLGESDVTFFAAHDLATRLRPRFPRSLDGAPMLMPTDSTMLRRDLDAWFGGLGVAPRVVAEIEDSALLASFGEDARGVFVAPSVVAKEVREKHRVERVGATSEVRERFYAITTERRLKHPVVLAMRDAARGRLGP